MNWVLTQAKTLTRSRSIRARVSSAENRSLTTVGTPTMVGVAWAVQMPKPNGAGTAPRKTSSSVRAALATANWLK